MLFGCSDHMLHNPTAVIKPSIIHADSSGVNWALTWPSAIRASEVGERVAIMCSDAWELQPADQSHLFQFPILPGSGSTAAFCHIQVLPTNWGWRKSCTSSQQQRVKSILFTGIMKKNILTCFVQILKVFPSENSADADHVSLENWLE